MRILEASIEKDYPAEYAISIGAIPEHFTLVRFRIKTVGPATLYEIGGYISDNNPSHFNLEEKGDIPSITYKDGFGEIPLLVGDDIIKDCHVGLTWLEPDGYHLRRRVIRRHLTSQGLVGSWEVYRKRRRLTFSLRPRLVKGRWISIHHDDNGYLSIPRR